MNVKGTMGGDDRKINNNWVVKEDNSDDSTSIGTFSEDSMNSLCSSSSSELNEDASSSSSSPSTSSHNSNGSLYDVSELMNHLPIKRGLSMFYEGKAQSFTSLTGIQSIEELPKKSISYSKRMKSCKSYGGCLDSHRIMYSPKATISKKASRGPFASMLNKRANLLEASRLSIAAQKNF